MTGLARWGMVFGLMSLLTACGGGDAVNPFEDPVGGGGGGGTTTDPVYTLGSGSGASFTPGVLDIDVTSLSAGGQTNVSASVVDQNGDLSQNVHSIVFNSPCSAAGLATITSPVNTTGGIATTTYTAKGCVGTDTITATTVFTEGTATATGTLTVQPATLGQLHFLSAIPPIISVRGYGLTEISEVTFQVLDTNGNPVSGQIVDFTLSTNVGGITLSDASLTSDVSGNVRVDVHSGTVATSVRVIATLRSNPELTTTSDNLVIVGGPPDQDSIAIGAAILNPDYWCTVNFVDVLTVIASDHFNNPVPDGTKAQFRTEWGQVQGECDMVDGRCTVEFRTSGCDTPPDGRVTILVTMLGEESFLDVSNGDEVLDDTDIWLGDMPEAFHDFNENGVYDPGQEPYLDFNLDGVYSPADGYFNGLLCNPSNTLNKCWSSDPLHESKPNIHVRDSVVIVIPIPTPIITFSTPSIEAAGGSDSTLLRVTDPNGQTMPIGTTISVETTNGELLTPGSYTVANTTEPEAYVLTVGTDGTSDSGILSVTVTTPRQTSASASIPVND